MGGMKRSLLALLFFPVLVFAQDFTLDKETGKAIPSFIGQLRLSQGKVFKRANGKLSEVYSGERFFVGNSLVTGKDSMAKVMMVDDSIVSLGPESEVRFKEFTFKDKENRSCEYELVKGQLRGNVPQKLKSGKIDFKTSYSTMGIRGTEILVNHRNLGSREVSEFALIEGKADLSGASGFEVGQHAVFIGNGGNKPLQETFTMKSSLLNELTAKALNDEKEWLPFLPYLDLESLPEDSILKGSFSGREEEKSPEATSSGSAPKNWRESLQKLNEQLKKNQR